MSKLAKQNKKYRSYLFKIAGAASISTALLAFILTLLIFNGSVTSAFIFALVLFISAYLWIYFILKNLLVKQLNDIERIIGNISQKHFEDYDNLSAKSNDELDALVRQCRAASKTMEREINRLNKIENYRKEFIGDISHELKTPIFAIQGFIETLLDGAIDDEKVNRDFLEKAMRNADRLSWLTKDLMEISRLETGELKSRIETHNLGNLIFETVENLQYKAEAEGVLIQTEEIDKNIEVRADRNQLRQVLINLIENGIKYNKVGGLVTVSAKNYSKNENKVLVTVKDTGIGIEPKYLERITERFFRIDKSRSRQKGGTGLGLAIVKHIIEAHGEEFFVESAPGEGSMFSFTLQKDIGK